jgi:probable F420-dependent oxidoreductase
MLVSRLGHILSSQTFAPLGVALAPSKQIGLHDFLELAMLADQLGYHSIWLPETWGSDAVSVLATVAVQTEHIKIAAGVLNVYSRSAALIAQTAATLQELSGGRFILGLGSSGPIPVEHWHGVPFRTPVQRTREYIAVVRAALSGERVEMSVGGMDLTGFRLLNPPGTPVPIYLAALGPHNVHLAGEVADGWLPIFVSRSSMPSMLGTLFSAMSTAGRLQRQVAVAAFLPCVVGPSGDRLLRQQLAHYIGGMGTFYNEFVRRSGFQTEAEQIARAWAAGAHREAVSYVSERLLDDCTLGHTVNTAHSRIQDYRDGGVSLPILSIPHGASLAEVSATLQALAPQPHLQ